MASANDAIAKDVLTAPVAKASSNKDRLSSLTPETLVKILSYVPISFFFALTQTSKGFRTFMTVNAALICNTAITTRFPLLAAKFESTLISKWLVPTHPPFLRKHEQCPIPMEHFIKYYLYKYPDSNISEAHEKYNYDPDSNNNRTFRLVDLPMKLFIDVTKPGPQYLLYLEFVDEYSNEISSSPSPLNVPCLQTFIWSVDMGYGSGLKQKRREKLSHLFDDEDSYSAEERKRLDFHPCNPRNLAWFYGPRGIPEAHAEGFEVELFPGYRREGGDAFRDSSLKTNGETIIPSE